MHSWEHHANVKSSEPIVIHPQPPASEIPTEHSHLQTNALLIISDDFQILHLLWFLPVLQSLRRTARFTSGTLRFKCYPSLDWHPGPYLILLETLWVGGGD